MHRLSTAIAALSFFCHAGCGTAQTTAPADAAWVRQAFDAQVLHPPTVATVGHAPRLLYELHLTSFARVPLTLSAVAVEDGVTGRVLHRLQGDALTAAVGGPGVESVGDARRTVQTGRRAIIYLELALNRAPPRALRHRVEFDVQAAAGPELAALVGAFTPVVSAASPILGPPLGGGPWVAVYDPALENGHRRYIYAVGGQARIPGRFAIDWMKPARSKEGAANDVAATGAGAPVLAVADAVVIAARDGVAEVAPGQSRPPVTLADATGNYIALDLGRGRYAFYEHLAPGLSVKPGDRVRRGQVIARLGSTGQASRPHLHFHVADANAPVGAEGQPYLLAGARVVGAYPSIAAFEEGGPWQPVSGQVRGPTLPPANSVIVFDEP